MGRSSIDIRWHTTSSYTNKLLVASTNQHLAFFHIFSNFVGRSITFRVVIECRGEQREQTLADNTWPNSQLVKQLGNFEMTWTEWGKNSRLVH